MVEFDKVGWHILVSHLFVLLFLFPVAVEDVTFKEARFFLWCEVGVWKSTFADAFHAYDVTATSAADADLQIQEFFID